MPWQIKFYFCTKIKSYITVIYYLPVMLKIYFPINCYLSNHIVFYFDSKTTVCQGKFKLLWAISKYRYSDIPLIRRHYRVFRYDTIYRYIDITTVMTSIYRKCSAQTPENGRKFERLQANVFINIKAKCEKYSF